MTASWKGKQTHMRTRGTNQKKEIAWLSLLIDIPIDSYIETKSCRNVEEIFMWNSVKVKIKRNNKKFILGRRGKHFVWGVELLQSRLIPQKTRRDEMINDNRWWYLMKSQYLMIQCMMVPWWYLTIEGDMWWFLVIPDYPMIHYDTR